MGATIIMGAATMEDTAVTTAGMAPTVREITVGTTEGAPAT
jgi:hypothetical protein